MKFEDKLYVVAGMLPNGDYVRSGLHSDPQTAEYALTGQYPNVQICATAVYRLIALGESRR